MQMQHTHVQHIMDGAKPIAFNYKTKRTFFSQPAFGTKVTKAVGNELPNAVTLYQRRKVSISHVHAHGQI